ncbi:MAG: Glycosyltransferase [Candidatus Woesebacteria bacterium GW2011_GWA1_41_13b]|uniref:Glycosyltransferase n=1 Tax=Candidatus Woesebacteria bacterium GW2011_GWA1_41_13b TaxID=1618555 RepID=A0A0G0X634_9BACT|nr:MAG: Glycosyltransferase [Candidatus Woesebacteria bacterium GW2011_GWA1_41_13b]
MRTSLSVVIPAYNEQDNISQCLTSVSSVLKKLKLDAEIIIVNDGSTDKTGDIAKKFIKTIPNLKIVTNRPNKGYGGSLKAGFATATKEFIVMTHADNQFDFNQVQDFLSKQAESNADIVSGIRVADSDPKYRQFLRWGWNTLVRAIFGYLATDIDCGFKLIRRSILKKLSLPSDGAMIDTQAFAAARARGLKIVELPVTHLPRTAGQSTGSNPQVIIKALKELLFYWWQLKQEILVEQGRAVFRWEAIIILSILILASFMRLWRIDQYMTFLGDEGRDVMVVRDMLLGRKFTLIGPGTSIGNMYLGPLYYYMMLLPLAVAYFSPVGPAIQIALLGVVTVALVWWIGRQWFGRVPALLISLLYSLSPTVITYSHSSWNPNIMPFFALVSIYGIWKVWRLGYWRWLVISAASFAFILNSHYLGLLLLPTIGLYWFLARKSLDARRYTLISVIVFFVLMSPLLFFDLRHNWLNFRAMAAFFTDRQTTVNLKAYKALPKIWPIWQDINTSLLAGKNIPAGIFTSAFLVIGIVYLIKSRPSKDFLFVLVWLGTGLIGLGLYKQHVYDHYYGFLFPAPFLLLGFIIEKIKKWSYLLLLLLFTVTITNSPLRFPPNNQLAHTREIAEFINTQSAGQPFNLALLAKRNYDKGYVYFLDLAKAPYYTIHQKLSEQLFVICEDPICEPINNPLWEVAAFGWAKVDRQWEFPWGTKLFRLVHNPSGK